MRLLTPLLLLILWSNNNLAQQRNTIRINSDDTHQQIIAKAIRVLPSANQLQALERGFIAFVHFGPNTFTRKEWGDGMEDPSIFDLGELDTDQWCEAMKAAGMKMVILTVKHHDGFVLWQSRYTNHGIMSSPFRNGKGDVLRDLSASCRKYGLKLGIYLSPADLFQIESPDGLYGNGSAATPRTIPRPIPGRPFSNPLKFNFRVDDYNEYFLNQLFELLTEYGPVSEVWFDGAHPKRKGGQTYNYAAWKKLIRTLAPQAVIFGREDIRWCGNEAGRTRATEWNVIPYVADPDTTSHFPDLTAEDLGSRERLYGASYLHYQPAETNTSIREGWFYRDDQYQKVRSADDVFDIYERSVGGNSIFLLNIPPNRQGRFSEQDVNVLKEVGKRITGTYGKNLFAQTGVPGALTDGKLETYIPATGHQLVFSLPDAVTVNRIILQEPVADLGERVEQYAVDAWLNGEWKEIASATNIGFKRILRFPALSAAKFRLRITRTRGDVFIATIGGYFYEARPPQLEIFRNKDGLIAIKPLATEFNWKPHGQDLQKNLYENLTIYYTVDGSVPDATSKQYDGPLDLKKGEIKAVAFSGGVAGPVARFAPGIKKDAWRILAGGNVATAESQKAIDDDPATFWVMETNTDSSFVIDLGQVYNLRAFSYTPQTRSPEGMMSMGNIEASVDGKAFTPAGGFVFGNLVNDPVRRTHQFPGLVNGRYIRFTVTATEGNSRRVAIAEIDFFE